MFDTAAVANGYGVCGIKLTQRWPGRVAALGVRLTPGPQSRPRWEWRGQPQCLV